MPGGPEIRDCTWWRDFSQNVQRSTVLPFAAMVGAGAERTEDGTRNGRAMRCRDRHFRRHAPQRMVADRGARAATVLFVIGVLATLFWPPAAEALDKVFK